MNINQRSKSHRRRIMATVGPWYNPGNDLTVWAAYKAKGAESLAASYVDLSGNSNNATLGNAPSWDSTNGWKFNGTNDCLVTTFVPDQDQSQSVFIQYTNLTYVAWDNLFGIYEAANRNFAISMNNATKFAYSNGGDIVGSAVVTSGNIGIAGSQGYLNGVADGGSIGAYGAAPTRACYIGARNQGFASAHTAVYIQALAIYSQALNATQAAAVAAAMAAL